MQDTLATRTWLAAYPPDVDWAMRFPPETLLDVLDATLAAHPRAGCMDFLGRQWSYGAFGALVDRAAAGLRRLGAVPGTRVGLCLPNTPFHVIGYFAALRAGGVVVNLNPLSPTETLAGQCADAGVSIVLTIDIEPVFSRVAALLRHGVARLVVCRFHEALTPARALAFRATRRAVRARVPAGNPAITQFSALIAAGAATSDLGSAAAAASEPRSSEPRSWVPASSDPRSSRPGAPGGLASGGAAASRPAVPRPGDLAVLQFTGGTTGTPKAVELTHANLAANIRQVVAWMADLAPGRERVLAVLPLFHVFGMTAAMNTAIAVGAELVLLPRYDARQVLATLRRCRPTVLPGVPTLYQAILDAGAGRAHLASVRRCISGGAPLPLELARAFEAASGCTLVEGYGLSEAAPVCFCNPPGAARRIGTIGLPLPGVEADIRALDDPARSLPPGQRGELCVRGPNVMARYWRRPEESEAALLSGGWLRTGDVGIMDAEGYVTLVDRIKDLILCSGFNVYPRSIEEALYRHPDVAAATALGMTDPYRGESPAVFVQLRPGAAVTPAELRGFLADKLSPVEMPELIEIRESLPRTAIGKLSRTELRAELEARKARPGGAAPWTPAKG